MFCWTHVRFTEDEENIAFLVHSHVLLDVFTLRLVRVTAKVKMIFANLFYGEDIYWHLAFGYHCYSQPIVGTY